MPQTSHLPLDSESGSYKELHFSPTLTALCLMVCVAGFALLLWSVSSSEGMPESLTASRDLERLASRMLGFESRLTDLSAFEKILYHLWWEDGQTQEQLRRWYAEIPQERQRPLDQLYMGILDGEAMLRTGRLTPLKVERSGFGPFPYFSRYWMWSTLKRVQHVQIMLTYKRGWLKRFPPIGFIFNWPDG